MLRAMTEPSADPSISGFRIDPIGIARTPHHEPVDAPRQPRAAEGTTGRIELFPGRGYEDALSDVATWDYLWVLFWFDRSPGWRPKVLPPRSPVKRGVFATRAPHRPNPIGLSVVRLIEVRGLVLHVEDVDLLDGTPVIDIKPYVAWSDAIPGAGAGWLDPEGTSRADADRPTDPRTSYEVAFRPLALEQLRFLGEQGEPLMRRIREVLSLGPEPHAYRRIRRVGDRHQLAVKDWRASFVTHARTIDVERIATGYRPRELFGTNPGAPELHRRFVERFGFEG